MKECQVCGSTETNLVDGFYYCVECGTQDETIRETAVEETVNDEGHILKSAVKSLKKRKKADRDEIQMSPEWIKWNTYNFLVPHMVDQLINLGAKPTLKEKVLWIWTRYIKKFCNKNSYNKNIAAKTNTLLKMDSSSDEDIEESSTTTERGYDAITPFTFRVLIAMLHVGLNLDSSDILLSHLIRFVREGRLNLNSSLDALPQDLYKKIDKRMVAGALEVQTYVITHGIHSLARKLFNDLDLGPPIKPDLQSILKNQIKELCLPNEFRKLVLSLMDYGRARKDSRFDIQRLYKFPNYESLVMSYIIIALKMCFGLDGVYEVDLSNTIDTINEKENHMKCYNLDDNTDDTIRMFSFRHWLNYLNLRKVFLCKYHQPSATYYDVDRDKRIAVDSFKNMPKSSVKKSMRQNMMSEIIEDIPIPKIDFIEREKFPISRTPISSYTEFIISHIEDATTRLALKEDFTKYSLKYACLDLCMPANDGVKTLLEGVTESNKKIKHNIFLTKEPIIDESTVFVKHTDNESWVDNFKDVIYLEDLKGNLEETESEETAIRKEEPVLHTIEELCSEENIFGNNLFDVDDIIKNELDEYNYVNDINTSDEKIEVPHNFNREEAIKQLIIHECNAISINIPRKYGDPMKVRQRTVPRERNIINSELQESKRRNKELLKKFYEHCFIEEFNITKENLGLNFNNNLDFNESQHLDIYPDSDNSDTQNNEEISRIDHEDNIIYQNDGQNTFDFKDYENLDADQVLELIEQKSHLNDIINKEFKVMCTDIKRKPGRKKKAIDSNSDDEPLSVIKEKEIRKNLIIKEYNKKMTSRRNRPFLINHETKKKLKNYNYYEKQYEDINTGAKNRSFLFEVELFKTFPISFTLILQHCASVIELDPFTMFVSFSDKEHKLMVSAKYLKKRRELYKKSSIDLERSKRKAQGTKKEKRRKRRKNNTEKK